MINLKIDPEFQSQIPPLTDDEFKQLEENIQPNASLTMIGLSAPTSTAVGILLNISFFLWLKRYENQTCA